MKKSWLIGAIAGVALLATACVPNYGTKTYNRDGVRDGVYTHGTTAYHDGLTTRGTDTTYRDGYTTATGFTGKPSTTGLTGTTGYPGTLGATGTGFPGTLGTTRYNTGYSGIPGTAGTLGTPGTSGYSTGYTSATTGYTPGISAKGSSYAGTHSLYKAMGTTTAQGTNTYANHVGFVKLNRDHLRTNSTALNNIYVDRDALAQVVGNVTASVPNVATSTVLVTDKEIFVGLNSHGKHAASTKAKARMSAESVSPRYFKVYVTDNQSIINEMSRVASRTTHTGTTGTTTHDHHIDRLIKSFGGKTTAEEMKHRKGAH